jgi:hypothetical protein
MRHQSRKARGPRLGSGAAIEPGHQAIDIHRRRNGDMLQMCLV